MPIKLEIIGDNAQEFATKLAGVVALSFGRVASAVGAQQPAPAEPQVTIIEPESVVTNTPRAGETAEQTETRAKRGRPKSTPAKTGGDMPDEKPEEVAALAPTITQADVKAKLIALLEAKGEEAPVDVLKEFGAAKLSEISQADYAKVIAKVDEMLKEGAS